MKKIVLFPNPERDKDFRVTRESCRLLEDQGLVCCGTDTSPIPGLPCPPLEDAFCSAQAVLCFGGDGTLLRCARSALPYNVPVLGINMGHTGFLTQIKPADLHELNKIASGNFTVQERMTLKAAHLKGPQILSEQDALNDIVVHRGATVQTISLDIRIEDRPLASFMADGAIIFSATGSTGYALSSGGPVVDPALDTMIITPICAHTAFAHSFVLSPDRVLAIHPTQADQREAYLSVDGQPPVRLNAGERVEISRSEQIARFIVLEGHTFFDNVRTKIHRM
ncbi:MAG: NAD(+)/NADH kinase [Oscillospiraceae bacterium]|nr:NAD(+)/NADH kinase [Oscillospiraceae bacterium]